MQGRDNPKRRYSVNAVAKHMATSEDGQFLAFLDHSVAHGEDIIMRTLSIVQDLSRGEERHRLTDAAKGWFMGLHFAAKSRKLFAQQTTNAGSRTSVWNLVTGKKIDFPKNNSGFPTAFSPDGGFCSNREVWNAQTLTLINPDSKPSVVAFKMWLSHTGDRAVVVGTDSISMWDANTGRQQRSFAICHLVPIFLGRSGSCDLA